jgi:hypothetical protein
MNDDSPTQLDTPPRHHNRWLILIAAFKLAQALLFAAVGVGVLRLLHKNVGDELQRFVDHLNFNTEPRFINFLLEKADIIDDHMLRRIGAAVFIYAGLDLVEGIGLYFEKTWAEYLTLVGFWPGHAGSRQSADGECLGIYLFVDAGDESAAPRQGVFTDREVDASLFFRLISLKISSAPAIPFSGIK